MKNKKAEVLIKYLKQAVPGVCLEIGCIRTEGDEVDGQSTLYLAQECLKQCRTFLSFDNEQAHVDIARKVLTSKGIANAHSTVFRMDGKKAIREICAVNSISFLFLDSHRHPAFTLDQYKEADLVPGAIVIIDDAQQIDEFEFGKAQFVKDYFDYHNLPYKIIETCRNASYQWSSMLFTMPKGKSRGAMK